ncbi:MAG: WXG100 family type VII secretion target [Mycobacteriales bacterium]
MVVALGFDPAPGSPEALLSSARQAEATGRSLAAAAGSVARLDPSWRGPAAIAFRDRLGELPRDLDGAAAAHRSVARALTDYADGLAGRRRRVAELERRAEELRVSGASLVGVLAEARGLHAEHRAAARAAAARVRAATDPPYPEPGVLARVTGRVRRWIADHAGELTWAATVLKGLSGALAVLCLVPGFQPLAPVAWAAAGLALGLDAAVRAATGRGSWRSLALDAVLTAAPAGPVARTIRGAPLVGSLLRTANRAMPGPVKGHAFRALRTLPEGISRGQLARAAARIRAEAGHLGDDVVVQGSRAGHSAGAGSDVDFGIRVAPERYAELVRECFDPVRNAEAMRNAAERGRIFWRRAGLKELHDGLRDDLGRRVDLAIIERGGLFDGEPWLRVR